ncbi:MAG: ATP-dependent 6-phosphofructokinase [Acidobacteriota bacterium]
MGKYIGILTGGGDCPGLNAVIRAIVRRAMQEDIPVHGIQSGWLGLVNGDIKPLSRYSVAGIQYKGGSILGTSRFSPLEDKSALKKMRDNWKKFGLDSLIVVGGNGTLSAATQMWRDEGYPIVGIPKTIDNDIVGTDYTIGFDTAVSIASEAIDRLHTTAESQHRVMVVEVMGRHTGWIATHAGLAGGADIILVPEKPFRISEICEMLQQRQAVGRNFSIVVVAEDARPHPDEDFLSEKQRERIYRENRLGGIGALVAIQIEKRIKLSSRVTVLGYIQRGGSPTAFDRVLATRLGVHAVEMVLRKEFGRMAASCGLQITSVLLESVANRLKPVDEDIFRVAEIFFG